VPFFAPIIRGLKQRGHDVMLTARDAFQVRDLLNHSGLDARVAGRHCGRNRLRKVLGLGWRAVQLLPSTLFRHPDLAVSHGARSQLLLCRMLGVPSVLIDDYEHSVYPPFTRPDWCIVPESIPPAALDCASDRTLQFTGQKEDVYAADFIPDHRTRERLGLREDDLVVTVRPPATEAHYHHRDSDVFFEAVMDHLMKCDEARVVLLPRNARQESELRLQRPDWFETGRIVVPDGVIEGLSLLWFSDLVVSGGGTMNREAAVLGVPVYSIFRGPTAAVDQHLQREGRLTLIRTAAEVRDKIVLRRRPRPATFKPQPSPALDQILTHLEHILQSNGNSGAGVSARAQSGQRVAPLSG
jgi:predicted glycosyltransferase